MYYSGYRHNLVGSLYEIIPYRDSRRTISLTDYFVQAVFRDCQTFSFEESLNQTLPLLLREDNMGDQ